MSGRKIKAAGDGVCAGPERPVAKSHIEYLTLKAFLAETAGRTPWRGAPCASADTRSGRRGRIRHRILLALERLGVFNLTRRITQSVITTSFPTLA